MKICGVYKITSPSNKIYIGSSVDIYNRVCSYKNYKCKPQRKLYNSLIKYGWEAHKFEIIEVCTTETMLKKELYYGLFYNVLDRNEGLNCKLPKQNEKYTVVSEETKERIGKANAISQKGKLHGYYKSKLKKLNINQVLEIKKILIENKLTQKEIGLLFNVSRKIISNITTGKVYKTIGENIDITKRNKKYIKLKNKDYGEIKTMYSNGISQKEIAKLFCVDASHISRIINNERYIKTLIK